MLTLFCVPKPFEGHVGVIQRNAIHSWKLLRPACQILLLGDEAGCGEVASELGVDWARDIETNEHGTPLLGSVFRRAEERSAHRLLCYANADLLLYPDILEAARQVASAHSDFLAVSEAVELDVGERVACRPELERLRRRARASGAPRGRQWIDLFLFPRGCIGRVPDFAVGRPGWDNWMIWRARSLRLPVVDVSARATVVHQAHGYDHVPESTGRRWEGPEGERNRQIVRWRERHFTLDDATHRLTDAGLVEAEPGGRAHRLGTELLLHERTIPAYRALRRCYASLRRAASRQGAGSGSAKRGD